MIKIFVSQPMSKFTDDEIRENRQRAIEMIKVYFESEGESDTQVIDNMQSANEEFEKAKHTNLKYLGIDISALADADIAFFMNGWEDARGCRIEKLCCDESDIPVIFEKDISEKEN